MGYGRDRTLKIEEGKGNGWKVVGRYNSAAQEVFAKNGRIKVIKIVEVETGYIEYLVQIPKGVAKRFSTKELAINEAKNVAQFCKFAFNPRIDYKEVRIVR